MEGSGTLLSFKKAKSYLPLWHSKWIINGFSLQSIVRLRCVQLFEKKPDRYFLDSNIQEYTNPTKNNGTLNK